MNMPLNISEFAKRSLQPSPVNEMTESFALDFREGIDINLGVGYVNDATIPGQMIQKALNEVLLDTKTYRNALNYGGAEGSPALRKAIKNYYTESNQGNLSEHDFENISVCIGANGATSLLDSIAEIIEPGIVITADPYYYIYCDTLERKGFEVVTVPEDNEGIRIDILEEKLKNIDTDRLRFFYIVTVNNPSCTIISNERKQKLVKLAETISDERGILIPVLFDKAYEDIIHDENITKPESGLKYETLPTVIELGTFSKVIAPALRVGYMLTRNKEFAKLIVQKVSDIGFSAPLINQEITAWLLDNHITEQLQKVNAGYRKKAEEIEIFLKEQLGEYLADLKGGSAGFYFYLTLPVETGKCSKFSAYLSRTTGQKDVDGYPDKYPRLIYIPGEYCVHPQGIMAEEGKHQLRISYGFETTEQIMKSVLLIKEAVEYALK